MVKGSGWEKAYAQIVARAWADEAFKARLFKEPETVLREYGIDLPEGAVVRPLENTSKLVHFVLPAKPAQELSEAQIAQTSGGMGRLSDSFCVFFP